MPPTAPLAMDAPQAANAQSAESPTPASQPPRSLMRRILSGGAWSLAGRIGSMGCLFLTNVIVVRSLGKANFSAFSTALSAMPFLAIVVTLGVPWTLVRVVRGSAVGRAEKTRAVRGALTLTIISAIVIATLYCIAAGFLPDRPKWTVMRDYRGFVGLWLALSGICIVAANYLQAEDDFRTAALVGARNGGLIPNGLTLLTVAALAAYGLLTLQLLLAAQVFYFLVAIAVAVVVIAPRLDRTPSATPEDSNQYSPAWFMRDSWPHLVNQSIAVLLVEVDLFWIACLADEVVVADYAVVRYLRLLVIAPLMVASIALPPFIAELYGRGEIARLQRVLRATATVLAAPSLAALIALLAAPGPIIRWVYGPGFGQAAPALQVAAIGAIVFVLSGNNALTLTMTGRHRALMSLNISALVLYVVISPPLVSRYGATGAAAAFTIQTTIQNILVTWWVKRSVGVWTIPLCSWPAARDEFIQLLRRVQRGKSAKTSAADIGRT